MRINISWLTTIVLFAVLFASCNTGNKIVSSFGKRKYTRGYYFNFITHKRPELPVVAAKKVVRASTPNIVQENHALINNKVSVITSSVSQVKEKKTGIWHIPHDIISKTYSAIAKSNIGNTPLYSPQITRDGIPGHGTLPDDAGRGNHDGVASAGFILAILSVLLLFAYGLGLIFIIPALICSIIGLKSKRRHTLAVIGLVVSIIEILAVVALIAILVVAVQSGAAGL